MSEQEREGPPAQGQVFGAIRLIFEYEGDEVRLISEQRVDMPAPPTETLEEDQRLRGFWAEVRSSDGVTLHRQVLHDPLRRDLEVFSDDPKESIVRIPVERPAGAFAVLVPDLERADNVALMAGRPPESPGLPAAATELLRVALQRDEKKGEP